MQGLNHIDVLKDRKEQNLRRGYLASKPREAKEYEKTE
jgi:hypothetical protein